MKQIQSEYKDTTGIDIYYEPRACLYRARVQVDGHEINVTSDDIESLDISIKEALTLLHTGEYTEPEPIFVNHDENDIDRQIKSFS